MTKFEIIRAGKLIDDIIKQLQINLEGLTILTEVGSGYFALSPIIALKAGAKKIFAWTKDSHYGDAIENVKLCKEVFEILNLDSNKIEFAINERPIDQISNSDIITNLGFVRPIDINFLTNVKPNTVIPIMCEAWEFRASDIDLEFCKNNNIKLAGTWENHPELKIFDGSGFLAAKMIFEAGYEIYQNNIAIWSNDNFGSVIFEALSKFKPNHIIKTQVIDDLTSADIIFIADYQETKTIAGKEGLIPLHLLNNRCIIHLCGKVDFEFLNANNIRVVPPENGTPRRMTRTLAYLGLKPIIDLHSAGFKVGEIIYKNQYNKLAQIL